MVLLASAELRARLRAVPFGFFFEAAEEKVVLAVKMPSHRIRYLYLVPLEYSIVWLACVFAGRLDVVLVSLPAGFQNGA